MKDFKVTFITCLIRGNATSKIIVVLLAECSVKGGGGQHHSAYFCPKSNTFYLRLKKNYFNDFKLNPGLKKKMVLFGKCFVKAGGGSSLSETLR